MPRNGVAIIFTKVNVKTDLSTTNTVFRAFAHQTRLRLLNLLLRGEVCVCDLCTVLGVLQPSISRHLGYLKRAGLVTERRRGKWKYYSVIKTPTGLHRTLLRCVRTCFKDVDLLRADLSRLEKLQRGVGRCEVRDDRRKRRCSS